MSDTGPAHELNPKIGWKDLQKLDDSALVSQLAAGNHDALAVVVDRYQQLVLSVARRIVRDESEAEEVVQTVFLEVFQHPAQFDPRRGTLKMWLLQFAYSRSLNRRAYLQRRQFYSQVDLGAAEVGERAMIRPSRMSCGESSRLVRQALRTLNPKQQEAIDLVYFQGLRLEEAAEKSGETEASMRHHYYRGLAKLRNFLCQDAESIGAKRVDDGIRLEVADADPRPI